jgi:AraC family transcriptional regulator
MQKHLAIIKELIDHIEENVSEEINIVALSKSFDLSPWHFQRLFKSLVRDSLGGYIRGRRLSRAAEMLLNTDLRIIDIAFQVGFTSHEAFTRSFKSHFSYSPKQFRLDKPSVLINQKPLLTEELFKFIRGGIQHNPIVGRRNAQHIVGFETVMPSPFNIDAGLCEMMSMPWLQLFDRHLEIGNRVPSAFCGLTISESGNFTENTLTYIAGALVTTPNEIPKGMRSYLLPAQQVAMFESIPGFGDDTIRRTVDYVYGYWLPNSSFKRGQGNDYLHLEGLTDFKNPVCSVKYVIPVEQG